MRLVFAALVAAQSMIFGLAVSMSPPEGMARTVLHAALAGSAILVFVLVGGALLRTAWSALQQGRIVMEQLFLLGIGGAFFASLHCSLTGTGDVYYEVVAILLAIYTFGQLIGAQRREAALAAARSLGAEFAECERRGADGASELIPSALVQPGDVILVAAGAGVAVDGRVRHGTAFVRESALTGESFPVVKRPGDRVLAGSHCLDQALEIVATAPGGERSLDRLLASVRQAQGQKTHLQQEADRLVTWFLPAVLAVSVLTFCYWTWQTGWEVGLFNALAVLVVACPCSMGLATPIGIWAALSALARRGVVVQDAELVENLGRCEVVVFDKTGTLGEEQLEVVDFVVAEGVDREELLRGVAAVEAASNHPIARAFRRADVPPAGSSKLIPGVGLAGEWQGEKLLVGNYGVVEHLFEAAEQKEASVVASFRSALRGDGVGSHEVWVAQAGRLVGLGLLRERLRESTPATLRRLQDLGIRCVVMTGDQRAVAESHGFAEVVAEMTAEEKAQRVRDLEEQGKRVLFVGDGINDAPAMAAASASLALGAGSELARETASGRLMTTDLRVVAVAIERGRRTLESIRRNLVFAAIYNIVGMSLAAAGVIHPVVAALLMLVSSFTVTCQALRGAQEGSEGKDECDEKKGVTRWARSHQGEGEGSNRWGAILGLWKSGWSGPRRLGGRATLLLVLGVVLQGVGVAYLGGFSGEIAGAMMVLFAVTGGVLGWLLWRRPLNGGTGMLLTMFSWGGLLMLVGWWADAGFSAVVRNGICLCGCADSGMGWGLFLQPNWMLAGMLVAAIPSFVFETGGGVRSRWSCWLAGLVGMILGMELSALLMALVPVTVPSAGAHFFATYAVMVLGMTWGMFAACRLWQGLARSSFYE